MLDGLGMAETTPGPLIMVLQFVGFMAGYRDPGALTGVPGGIAASVLVLWVTFAPCFMFVFLGAPLIERLQQNRALAGALAAITARWWASSSTSRSGSRCGCCSATTGRCRLGRSRSTCPSSAASTSQPWRSPPSQPGCLFGFKLGHLADAGITSAAGLVLRFVVGL